MSVFQTERPTSPGAILLKQRQDDLERQINRDMFAAKRELEQQAVVEQAEMLTSSEESERIAHLQAMQEALAHRTKLEKARSAYVSAVANMPKDGRKQLLENFLLHIVNESLWVDDVVKNTDESQVMIAESFHDIVGKCEAVTGEKLENTVSNSKLLSYVNEVVGTITDKACERILKEAADTGEIDINFQLNDEESDELYDKLSDINPESISQAVRDKVLDTVKDEKECGKVKAELFKELEDEESEEEPIEGEEGTEDTEEATPEDATEDDADEVAESLIGSSLGSVLETIGSKDDIHDGYDIRVLMKLGDKEALHENYQNAEACYSKAYELCEKLRNRNRVLMPTEFEYVKESLSNAITTRKFSVSRTSGRALIREEASGTYLSESLNETLLDLGAYCTAMSRASRTRNVNPKTAAQVAEARYKDRINRALTNNTGSSLFESLLIVNTRKIEQTNPVLESGAHLVSDEIDNAAMIQTLLEYTIYETLNTLKVFNFDTRTVDKLKAM